MSGRQLRALALDDDRAVVDTICALAARIGVDGQGETDPGLFLALADTWQPDFILLDLLMPNLDGVEVIRALAERSCKASLILISGVGTEVLEAAGRAATERGLNVAGTLSKPLTQDKLRRLVERAPMRPQLAVASAPDTAVTIADLRAALDRDQIGLAFQPQVECLRREVVGFEALARWHHPERGLIMPDRFIHLAERGGLIGALTDRIVERALDFAAGVGASAPMGVSVNLSMLNLRDLTLADRVATRCKELGVSPRQVTFELTETGAMEDPASALDLLTRLRMKGFCLSIDDFGTGYSSMLQLVRLPFTEIKIDRSFVSSSRVSAESMEVIRSVVALGKGLGLEIVAEGVEDEEMLACVAALGCDRVQGFHVGVPLRADEIPAWRRSWEARNALGAAGPNTAVS